MIHQEVPKVVTVNSESPRVRLERSERAERGSEIFLCAKVVLPTPMSPESSPDPKIASPPYSTRKTLLMAFWPARRRCLYIIGNTTSPFRWD